MAGAIFTANTTVETLLAASSAKVLIRLISSTNSVVKIKEWGVYFDGVNSTQEPVVAQLCGVNTSSTASAYTTHTPTLRHGPSVAARCVIQTMAVGTALMPDIMGVIATREVHPQTGYQEKFAYGEEILCSNGSTAQNGTVAIIVNSPASVNAMAELVFEE